MSLKSLHYESLSRVASLIRRRKISPVELAKHQFERINDIDPGLHAFVLLTKERALRQARQAEEEIRSNIYRGPLHGIPIALKDLFYVAGSPTAGGLDFCADFLPDYSATVVERLDAAGAVMLGKLAMTEGAAGNVYSPSCVRPVNPWRGDLYEGASSSGSGVATAAGLCFASLGSDTAGSLRYPCAQNGLTGLKVTYGLVSRFGVYDLAPSLDTFGPVARSAEDCAIVLSAIAGRDSNDPTCMQLAPQDFTANAPRNLKGVVIGFDPALMEKRGVEKKTRAALEDALAVFTRCGAAIREFEFPDISEIEALWFEALFVEIAGVHKENFAKNRGAYDPVNMPFIFEIARSVDVIDYPAILQKRAAFAGRVAEMFDQIDLFLSPVIPWDEATHERIIALADRASTNNLYGFNWPVNFAGIPAMVFPASKAVNGPPVSLQLLGPILGERSLLGAVRLFQSKTDWHDQHPEL
ncbi:MAG: amidase [Parvularculaceae bacterium]|nr:amidase [Parvularculaceae bacterium]